MKSEGAPHANFPISCPRILHYQSEGGERRIGPLWPELLMLLLSLLLLLHRLASAVSSKLVGETPGRHVTLVREPFFIFFFRNYCRLL